MQPLAIPAAYLLFGCAIGWIAHSIRPSFRKARATRFQFKISELSKDDPDNAIILENYKDCRSLIQKNIDIMEKNETYIVGAIAAIVTFGLGQTERPLFVGQALLVPSLAVIGAARWIGLRHVIRLSDDYSREIEKHLPITGWATYYEAHHQGILGRSREALWVFIITCSILYAGYCLFIAPQQVRKSSASVSISATVN